MRDADTPTMPTAPSIQKPEIPIGPGRLTRLLSSLGLGVLALSIGLAAGLLSGISRPTNVSRLPASNASGGTPVAFLPAPRFQKVPARDGGRVLKARDSKTNFALRRFGSVARGGVRPELLIDGRSSDYDGVKGFAYTNWAKKVPPAFIITLKKVVLLNAIRFLLWDVDERFFRYRLEVSSEAVGHAWVSVADFSGEHHERRGWQNVFFETQKVRRIRLTGTYNSENNGFQVIEIQAFRFSSTVRTTVGDREF